MTRSRGRAGPRARRCRRPATPAPSCRREPVTIRVPSGLNPAEMTAPSWPRRTTGSPLPSARHTRAVLSHEAVTIRVPSGLNPAEVTRPRGRAGPRARRCRRPSTPAPSRPGAGDDPGPVRAERRPTMTSPSWPRRTRGSPLPSAIHTRAVLSSEPVTILVPSGLNPADGDRALVAAQDQGLAAAVGPPHPRRVVLRAGDDPGPVRAEPGRDDRALVAAQDHGLAAAVGPPHPRRVVPGAGDDPGPVGAEPGRGDRALVAAQDQGLAAAVGPPHPRRVVVRAGDDPGPVRAEPGRGDPPSWPRRTTGSPLPSARHTRAVLSPEAVTIRVPSGLNPAEVTPPSWPRRTRGSPLPSARHTRAVLSSEAVTIRVPSGLNPAEVTAPSWPRRTRISRCAARASCSTGQKPAMTGRSGSGANLPGSPSRARSSAVTGSPALTCSAAKPMSRRDSRVCACARRSSARWPASELLPREVAALVCACATPSLLWPLCHCQNRRTCRNAAGRRRRC